MILHAALLSDAVLQHILPVDFHISSTMRHGFSILCPACWWQHHHSLSMRHHGAVQVAQMLLPCMAEQGEALWQLAGRHLPALAHSRRLSAGGQALLQGSMSSAGRAVDAFAQLCRSGQPTATSFSMPLNQSICITQSQKLDITTTHMQLEEASKMRACCGHGTG